MNSGQRETGVVAMFDIRGGYGFIRPSTAGMGDVYVHWTNLRETGLDALEPGQSVKFVRHRLGQRWYAARVRLMVEAAA